MKLSFHKMFSTKANSSKLRIVIAALIMPAVLMFILFAALANYLELDSFEGPYFAVPLSLAVLLTYVALIYWLATLIHACWVYFH